MGNTTAKKVGDFQAGVGKIGADVGVITATIFAVILIIVAIVMTIMALIPVKPWDCPDRVTSAQKRVNFMCTGKFQQGCSNARTDLMNTKKYCSTKSRRLILLLGLLFIPLALLMVWGAHWWKREVHHSKTAAEIGGSLFEYNALQGLFGNN